MPNLDKRFTLSVMNGLKMLERYEENVTYFRLRDFVMAGIDISKQEYDRKFKNIFLESNLLVLTGDPRDSIDCTVHQAG